MHRLGMVAFVLLWWASGSQAGVAAEVGLHGAARQADARTDQFGARQRVRRGNTDLRGGHLQLE